MVLATPDQDEDVEKLWIVTDIMLIDLSDNPPGSHEEEIKMLSDREVVDY